MPIDYTTVIGVDDSHVEKLGLVWQTWKRHKPSLFDHPLIAFVDSSISDSALMEVVRITKDHPDHLLMVWPYENVTYPGDPNDKWTRPQRYKMLAGFVHVPARMVETTYWLKLDLDTVATGQDDWINLDWFSGLPAIVSHPWGYTKPANQMLELDEWFARHAYHIRTEWPNYPKTPPLGLRPKTGSSMVKHKRIISWCAFFNTEFTRHCSDMANRFCGKGKLPVPSQDGYLWYMAKRGDFGVVRANMKRRGWQHKSTNKNVRKAVEEALQ